LVVTLGYRETPDSRLIWGIIAKHQRGKQNKGKHVIYVKQNLCGKDTFKGQFISGQTFLKPFSSNPELHLVPWISKSFKLVALFPRNCGLGGSQ
jgi:hypothetical protein